jgi:hypothetical protein
MNGQTGINVGHEDLRDVAELDSSTKPGGPPHFKTCVTNVMAEYN